VTANLQILQGDGRIVIPFVKKEVELKALPWATIVPSIIVFCWGIAWALNQPGFSRLRTKILSGNREMAVPLERIRFLTSADRVILVEIQGTEELRLVAIEEVVKTGTPRASDSIDVENECAMTIVESFREAGFRKRISAEIEDLAYRQFLEGLGVNFAILVFLDGEVKGFLAIHYLGSDGRRAWEQVDYSLIAEDAGYLSIGLTQSRLKLNRLVSVFKKIPFPRVG
jgi:hypothetical protein